MNVNNLNSVGNDQTSTTERNCVYPEPPPPYTTGNVVNQQPVIHQTIILQAPLKDVPMYYNCPQCCERVLTKVVYENSKSTHFMAGCICGLTLWCLLCCLSAIPYYLKSFKKAYHYCPNCESLLGTYSKI